MRIIRPPWEIEARKGSVRIEEAREIIGCEMIELVTTLNEAGKRIQMLCDEEFHMKKKLPLLNVPATILYNRLAFENKGKLEDHNVILGTVILLEGKDMWD